jgi:hypothetical protein
MFLYEISTFIVHSFSKVGMICSEDGEKALCAHCTQLLALLHSNLHDGQFLIICLQQCQKRRRFDLTRLTQSQAQALHQLTH